MPGSDSYTRKQIDSTIFRSRETANKVDYDTSLRINDLETAIAGVAYQFKIIRNTVSIAVFILGIVIIVCGRRSLPGWDVGLTKKQ